MKSPISVVLLTGLDQQIQALRTLRDTLPRPARGWLRAVREAVGLAQHHPAKKLGIKRQAWPQLEESEARESISVSSLRRAAAALDCDLVYFLVPRDAVAKSYAELAAAHDSALHHLHASEHSMALEGQAVGDLRRPARKPRPR